MLITKKLLVHLAHLARLELTDDESARFAKDLNAVVRHFKDLDSVVSADTVTWVIGGGEGLKNITRTDRVSLSGEAESVDEEGHIVRAFPDFHEGHLKVQKIL
jgi:aspartyl/glutamyl-tRNA(Asn/Gln) amidotransferase C subunit